MPSALSPTNEPRDPTTSSSEERRSFPPITREHIINCSYDQWYPKYRSSCLPSCIIPLPAGFVEYLREDGIILANDEDEGEPPAFAEEEEWRTTLDDPSVRVEKPKKLGVQAAEESDDDDDDDNRPPPVPPNQRFPELHQTIRDTIKKLGGAVVPKLNWSAPKDAIWISRHQNSLKCTSPNDIYILLKSSSFVSHDLENAFDGCTPQSNPASPFPHVLVLRPFFAPHPSLEFRCFVKQRTLIGATPRDLAYYPFLFKFRDVLMGRMEDFFEKTLRFSFPDDSFVFDVYVPENDESADELGKVCLIDINPWAPTTDSLLWGWQELLDMQIPKPLLGAVVNNAEAETGDTTTEDEDDLEPELRLVDKDDPAAYNMTSPQYSAHKLPKDVVDASAGSREGLREFLSRWKDLTENRGDSVEDSYTV